MFNINVIFTCIKYHLNRCRFTFFIAKCLWGYFFADTAYIFPVCVPQVPFHRNRNAARLVRHSGGSRWSAGDAAWTSGLLSSFRLRRLLHAARTSAVCFRFDRLSPWLGAVTSDRQNAADCLQWSTVFCAVGTIWGSARIRTGPAVVRSVHSWAGPRRWPSLTQPAPVCRWHAGLHQHTGWWRWGCRLTSYCVSCRHRGMVEGQPTLTEPHQDPSDVVGFFTTAGKSQRWGGFGGVGTCQHLGDGP